MKEKPNPVWDRCGRCSHIRYSHVMATDQIYCWTAGCDCNGYVEAGDAPEF